MSYILDALRKSEHERQIAAGQSAGMLYPVEIKQYRKPWLIPALLVMIALITLTAIWWVWSRPIVTGIAHTIEQPAITVASQLPAIPVEALPQPELISKPKKLIFEQVQRKISTPTPVVSQPKLPTQTETSASAIATLNKSVNADPLNELPALNITGYIHNEQSGSLAMINNQLVHEGEEVSPGLLLVKILDNSAIFSYKGYVFSR